MKKLFCKIFGHAWSLQGWKWIGNKMQPFIREKGEEICERCYAPKYRIRFSPVCRNRNNCLKGSVSQNESSK